jgi:hypothetical protein
VSPRRTRAPPHRHRTVTAPSPHHQCIVALPSPHRHRTAARLSPHHRHQIQILSSWLGPDFHLLSPKFKLDSLFFHRQRASPRCHQAATSLSPHRHQAATAVSSHRHRTVTTQSPHRHQAATSRHRGVTAVTPRFLNIANCSLKQGGRAITPQ